MFKLVLEKAEEPEIKLPTSAGSLKKQESFKETSISALLTMPKPLCGSQQTVENSERDENTRPPDLPLEKPVCRSSQGYGFPSGHVWCESWTVKKAERRRIDAFELWCWRRLSRVPWSARRSNQSILKEIIPECLLEGLMLKLKLQYFGHLI